MIGDAGCRVLMQVLGYMYPGYLTFKDIEQGASDRLQLWCMYWVIMAALTAVQPFADTFLFFVPFYYSLKLAFACYLWANNLQGTRHVYSEYVRPCVRRYEPLVDYKLSQLRTVVSQVVSSNASKAVRYVQMLLVKTLSQSVAEREAGGDRSFKRDDSGSFYSAQEDVSHHHKNGNGNGNTNNNHRAYFDRTQSPLRAGSAGGGVSGRRSAVRG